MVRPVVQKMPGRNLKQGLHFLRLRLMIQRESDAPLHHIYGGVILEIVEIRLCVMMLIHQKRRKPVHCL